MATGGQHRRARFSGPGYNSLAGDETKTEIDPARRQIVDSGVMGKFAAPCRKTISEYQGGHAHATGVWPDAARSERGDLPAHFSG